MSILTKREIGEFRNIVESAGASFVGVQHNLQNEPALILFNEPKYRSTASVRVKNVNKITVERALREARLRFGA